MNTVLYVLTFLPLLITLRPGGVSEENRYLFLTAVLIAVPSCVLVIRRQVAGWQLTVALLIFYGIGAVGGFIQQFLG